MKRLALLLAFTLSVFICQAKEYAGASDWPCEVKTAEAVYSIFEPSVENFEDNNLKIRSAVSIEKANSSTNEPLYGAVWLTALSSNDTVNRKVTCDSLRVARFRCPDAEDMEITYAADLQNALKGLEMTFDLDYVLRLEREENAQTRDEAELKNDPPKILCVTNATVLVSIDGSPIMRNLDDAGNYEAVANTPYCLVFDTKKSCYYLKGATYWLTAPNLQSDFVLASGVPDVVKSYGEGLELSDDEKEGFKDVLEKGLPRVIVVTEPTELIEIDGAPKYKNVEGTDIMYAENTENDLFYCASDAKLYVLLSGRWYTHIGDDQWEYVPPDKLPSGFYKMTADNGKESALPHIKGTYEAKEAVADTYVPQTVKVARKVEEPPEVIYDGTPQFKEIPEAYPVAYAINTPHDVIKVNDRYYLCEDAVWYESADPLTGWTVCINVPTVIYSIPPAYPVYHVRYVRVYNYTPDYVYVGYYPGYVGCFVDRGVVVYGTGYRYAPWVGTYYYPWPATFGFGLSYNLGFGWGFNISWGAPMGWVGFGFCWSNWRWGYHHHHHWHGGHGHWWGRGCGPWDHHHVYRHHGRGCGDRYHHGPKCPGGRGPAPGPGQVARKHPAGSYLKDEPVKSANRTGTPASSRVNRPTNLGSNLRADKNGNVYSGRTGSPAGRVGTAASGSSASRTGAPGSSTGSRVGTPSSGTASRVGTPSSGTASRVGTPGSSTGSRVGTPSSGTASRVGTPGSSTGTRVGTPSSGTASRVGTAAGSSSSRTGSVPTAGRVNTSPSVRTGTSTGGTAVRTGTSSGATRVVNNPSTIGNTRTGIGRGANFRNSNTGTVRQGAGAVRSGSSAGTRAGSGASMGSAARSGASAGARAGGGARMGGGGRAGGGARMGGGGGRGGRR